MTRPAVEVLEPGPLTLVQDLGRFGHLAIGVGRAGAADLASYRLGGRLVGNVAGAAALEVTFGGLALRVVQDVLLALTGAPAPALVDGLAMPHAAPVTAHAGQEVRLGRPPRGLRTYVSIRGGLAVPAVLGSRSTDTMSGLGPPPLAAGQLLDIGEWTQGYPNVDVAPVSDPPAGTVDLVVMRGPRADWFARPKAIADGAWTVSDRSDRKGIRLEGVPLERHPTYLEAELPSEGMVRGAIQVPPNGLPVLLLNDHPVTGGYPVVGVVRTVHIDRAAQLRPGQSVRLRWGS
jgi:biotin-dependent carboxylase-like uncharacterized protein